MDIPLYLHRFGAAEFDEAQLELRVNGVAVELEHKPLQVLAELLRHAGEVLTRQELKETVWGGRTSVDQVLSNSILKLRRALSDQAGDIIVTVPRVGYKLVGPVHRVAVGRRLVSRLAVSPGAPVPGRSNFVLESQVDASAGVEVWLARHAKTSELRVFKLSVEGERLVSLKREATLYRLLNKSLGARDDIARVLDWNFETPPFFLECEYGGDSLDVWAEKEDRLQMLDRHVRLQLFLQIADAVAAAHQAGVLHKDLKPANVLVAPRNDGSWQLRVADFGSGRLMDPERLEQLGITRLEPTDAPDAGTGSNSGTPLYLAPELIAGQLPTVQSDLFALGLMLYQLVVGDLRKPMASGWEHDVADDLLVEDIAAATDGNPARRLTGVGELAQRLRALETRRAERAAAREAERRLAAAERIAARSRAQRPWAIAAIAILALGLAVALSLYRGEKNAQRETERERLRAEQINLFLTDDLLGAADPSGPGGAHNPTMRDVLAGTAARLESRFATDPETKASIDLALGNAYFGMTDYADAEKHRRRAVELLTAARGAGDSKTLEAEYQLISILVQTNRLDAAGKMLDSADRLAGRRLSEYSELALKAHWSRAGYFKLHMSPGPALEEYSAAERIRTVVEPANDALKLRLRDALSWCYARLNRNEDAERVLRDLMTPAYPPERVGPLYWAQARIDYGISLKVLGRNDEAERVMVSGLRELREALGADHYFVAVVQNELGDLYVRQSRWPQAVDSLREAYAILRKRSGEHGQATLIAATNLGIVEYRTGHLAEAVQVLSGTHEDMARQLGLASPQAQSVAFYLAAALSDIGRNSDAAELLAPLKATDLAAAEPREDWEPRLAALRAEILIRQGDRRAGLPKLAAAVERMEASHAPPEDVAPLRKLLAGTNGRSVSSSH